MAYSGETAADTTKQTTKLTPKEAFQHIKALWPAAEKIVPYGEHNQGWWASNDDGSLTAASEKTRLINWGTATQYPEPPKVWRPATPADVVCPHKEARFRDNSVQDWVYGRLIGFAYRGAQKVWVNACNVGFHYWQCEVCD